jgi:hypothetical protein
MIDHIWCLNLFNLIFADAEPAQFSSFFIFVLIVAGRRGFCPMRGSLN